MSRIQRSQTAPVFLIGYMASGKTTLGRALACATGRSFVDLDEYIEQTEGKSVSHIFADSGETHFRELETRALTELVEKAADGLIVACGGGTPCFGDNLNIMNSAGLTVWLSAPVEVIVRRLVAERASRPLVARLADGDELENYVRDNLARREPFYSRAAVCFDSSSLETQTQIDNSVRMFIDNFLSKIQ